MHGDTKAQGRLARGHALVAERFAAEPEPLQPGALGDAVVTQDGSVKYVVVGGRLVVANGKLVTGDFDGIVAQAQEQAARAVASHGRRRVNNPLVRSLLRASSFIHRILGLQGSTAWYVDGQHRLRSVAATPDHQSACFTEETKPMDPVPAVAAVDERLPTGRLAILGLQHVLVMYAGAIAVPLIIGRALQLSPQQVAMLISADLFCCGLVTLIQSWGATQWFGIRLPVMMGVTFAAVAPMVTMANSTPGLAGAQTIFGAVIGAGIVSIADRARSSAACCASSRRW